MTKTKTDAFIVSIDKNDTPHLLERTTFEQYAFNEPGNSFKRRYGRSKTDQLELDAWQEFKKPELKLDFLANLLRINTHHEACCRRVAHDVGGHGWSIVPQDKDETNYLDNTNKNFINNWLTNFNNNIEDIFYQFMYDFEAIGCSAIEIIRANGPETNIVDLQPMNPCYLRLHKDGTRVQQFVQGRTRWFTIYGNNYDEYNSKYYINKDTGRIETENMENVAHEIIWARNYSTNANNYGHAKVSTVLDVISGEIGRMNYNNKFFENYGMPAFAVSITGDFIDYEEEPYYEDGTPNPNYDETQTLHYKIQQQLSEVIQNPHSAVTIAIPSVDGEGNVDVKFTPLSVDQKEASFRLYRQDNKEEICEAHGFSSDLIGTTKSGTLSGSTAAEDNSEYVDNVIEPLQIICENVINDLLRIEYNITDWKFKFNDIRKKDITETINQCHQLWLDGIITRREYMETVGKQFGANSDVDDPYVDEYMINAMPVSELYAAFPEPAADPTLERLQENLLDYAIGGEDTADPIDDFINNEVQHEANNNTATNRKFIGSQDISNKKGISKLKKIIIEAIKPKE